MVHGGNTPNQATPYTRLRITAIRFNTYLGAALSYKVRLLRRTFALIKLVRAWGACAGNPSRRRNSWATRRNSCAIHNSSYFARTARGRPHSPTRHV